MNKKTKALTTEQYKEIIQTMREGFSGCRPNERIATALVLEGNLGLRISDILKLRLCDIVRDGDRYRLDILEQKTGKHRIFTVPLVIYQYIENYCLRNGIGRMDTIFPITERMVQKQLHIICDYLGYEGISTHSFRKLYATEIYKANGYDIVLVQRCYSTAVPPPHSGTSVSNHSGLRRQFRIIRSYYKERNNCRIMPIWAAGVTGAKRNFTKILGLHFFCIISHLIITLICNNPCCMYLYFQTI